MNNVIRPLLHYDACASMNRVVCVVKEQLQRGSLYNVREVEIMLMYYAPVSLVKTLHVCLANRFQQYILSEEILCEFRGRVRTLCDKLQSPYPGTCRMRQYCDDIKQMQTSLQEHGQEVGLIGRAQQAIRSQDSPESYRVEETTQSIPSAVHRSKRAPQHVLRTLLPAREKFGDTNIGPVRLVSRESPVEASSCPSTPASSLFSNDRAGRRRRTFNSSIDGSVISSPNSSNLSKTDDTVSHSICLRCPDCDSPFRGSAVDCRNNLKRHQRAIHNRKSVFRCAIGTCLSKFTRSDNRLKHQKKQHGFEAQSIKKKRKVM